MSTSKPAGRPQQWLQRSTAPVALALAGRRWFPLWAVVHHRGRRSGTAYDTPVAIVPTRSGGTFLIGLPWGPKTNWARNVLAAEGATVTWKGSVHEGVEPRLIEAAEAAALARPFFRPIVRRIPHALVLTRR